VPARLACDNERREGPILGRAQEPAFASLPPLRAQRACRFVAEAATPGYWANEMPAGDRQVCGSADQQVTCKIAFVSFGSACRARMASLVWDSQQFHLAPSGLLLHLVHHGKGTVSPGPDHEAPAVPGDVLLDRHWGVAEDIA